MTHGCSDERRWMIIIYLTGICKGRDDSASDALIHSWFQTECMIDLIYTKVNSVIIDQPRYYTCFNCKKGGRYLVPFHQYVLLNLHCYSIGALLHLHHRSIVTSLLILISSFSSLDIPLPLQDHTVLSHGMTDSVPF